MTQEPLFEIISADEFVRETQKRSGRKTKELDTSDRTFVGWYNLPTHMGFCNVPGHDELIQSLSDEARAYRQRHEPNRFVITIGELQVCRDCYITETDLQ